MPLTSLAGGLLSAYKAVVTGQRLLAHWTIRQLHNVSGLLLKQPIFFCPFAPVLLLLDYFVQAKQPKQRRILKKKHKYQLKIPKNELLLK